MTLRRLVPGLLLLLLLAAAAAGLHVTRPRPAADAGASSGAAAPAGGKASGNAAAAGAQGADPRRRNRTVDTRALVTARRLMAVAQTPEEQDLARQAEKLADHAIDLAFADRVRQVAEETPDQSPELKGLAEKKRAAQQAVAEAEAQLKALGERAARAPAAEREALGDQVEVARAQLELLQDELAEAAENLERAGGDPQARIRRLREVYEAAQKEPRPAPMPPPPEGGSLLARLRALSAARDKRTQLVQATQETQERVQRLEGVRGRVQKRVEDAQQARAQARQSVATVVQGAAGEVDRQAAQATAAALRAFKNDQQRLTIIGKRIQDNQDLIEVYTTWGALAQDQVTAALHRALGEVLWIAVALLVTWLLTVAVDRLFEGVEKEKLRAGTLKSVVKFAVQLVGLLVVLFIVVGMPGQATTILGLAGAGLTVAMKDFIVAFFGWFILMGRNGIRVGDWVEIKGVGGEVVEIGLLHTVLLETGSWTDAGHPTGRRVAFVNSFAIEGHYFNFSTSGQWMWDELRVIIPPGQDPYPVIEGVQQLVEKATEQNARSAEQEWQKAASRYRVRTFSAVPGINVVPGPNGVEIQVRYITRAHERHDARSRLYRSVVALMHGKGGEGVSVA